MLNDFVFLDLIILRNMNKAILALVIIGAAFATTSEDVLATIKRV